MKKELRPLFTVFLCFAYIISFGQTTSLSYRIKGKSTFATNISFADESGNTSIQPTEFFNYSEIHFVLSPTPNSPKEYFKEDYVNEILSQIVILQNEILSVNQLYQNWF